ncbi:unnamed protein product [Cyprideis torosa]|uniref:Uncharacterized protein n=1 Tax=Cyprideis torosa TaxID=163714 RepID=A0A7R8ZKH1_9CRUS|nr:unnamed protein product [Cyprideis torosa]CAG0881692.1 unnamed protein product [Cyprideis torosa]
MTSFSRKLRNLQRTRASNCRRSFFTCFVASVPSSTIFRPVVVTATPNPQALRITPITPVLPPGLDLISFRKRQLWDTSAKLHHRSSRYSTMTPVDFIPIGVMNFIYRLFDIRDINGVFLTIAFLTVFKQNSTTDPWDLYVPDIKTVVEDQMNLIEKEESSEVVDPEETYVKNYFYLEEDVLLADKIHTIFETYIRPVLQMDGGDCFFMGYEGNTVYMRLLGSCRGCPFVEDTLMDGILKVLTYHASEVEQIVEMD